MNDPTPISDQLVLDAILDPVGTADLRLEIFREQLNQRWIAFDMADNTTWPAQDGLYIGITRETGRIAGIVLQWVVGMEPKRVWKSVERYVAFEDILPELSNHTHHSAHREAA